MVSSRVLVPRRKIRPARNRLTTLGPSNDWQARERLSMKTQVKVAGMLAALLLVATAALTPGPKVSAAGNGNITGTVKLDGTVPHMKGIDMSKDPYCVSQHKDKPATLENVVVGSGGGIENVVLYLSEG